MVMTNAQKYEAARLNAVQLATVADFTNDRAEAVASIEAAYLEVTKARVLEVRVYGKGAVGWWSKPLYYIDRAAERWGVPRQKFA